ncbi:MAG: hypothetical protein IPG50_07380 [Myxococcales bacterium]|nr:hypothetical protein [Myxococcales bacterium]
MLDAPVIPAAPPPPPPRPAFPPPPKPEGDRQHISVGQLEKWKGVKAAHPERYGKADALYPGDQTQGTCSLMVCGQLIEAQTGTRLTEADLMGRGVEAGVWTPEQGMSSLGAKQILHDAGVAAVDIPHDPPAPGRYVNWDPMDPSSLGPISHRQGVVQAIDEGYGVLSSHDAKKLYNDPRAGGGHAIMPVDVVRDAAGNVTHVVVNDTSGALGSTVPIRADLYFDSLSGAIRTETPIWGP